MVKKCKVLDTEYRVEVASGPSGAVAVVEVEYFSQYAEKWLPADPTMDGWPLDVWAVVYDLLPLPKPPTPNIAAAIRPVPQMPPEWQSQQQKPPRYIFLGGAPAAGVNYEMPTTELRVARVICESMTKNYPQVTYLVAQELISGNLYAVLRHGADECPREVVDAVMGITRS